MNQDQRNEVRAAIKSIKSMADELLTQMPAMETLLDHSEFLNEEGIRFLLSMVKLSKAFDNINVE